MRKRYSAEFKAKVALEAIREKETLNKLASRHGVSRVQIQHWKKLVLRGIPQSFSLKNPDDDEKDKLIGKRFINPPYF